MENSQLNWDSSMEQYSSHQQTIHFQWISSVNHQTFLPQQSPTSRLPENILFSNLSLPSQYTSRLQAIIQSQPLYLHSLVQNCSVPLISQFLGSVPKNLSQILNHQDSQGNTALMLAVKNSSKAREFLSIVSLLLYHNADPKIKDIFGWSPIDEAIVQKNRDLVNMVFQHLHNKRFQKWTEDKKFLRKLMKEIPDFYIEFKWEFNSSMIPFVSKLAPNDTCKIWKLGKKLRVDTSFVGWRKLRTKRRPLSLFFDKEIWIANHMKKTLVNPLETLDPQQIDAIVNDLLTTDPVQGNFNLIDCKIFQQKNWRDKPIKKKIQNWNCEKHKLMIQAQLVVLRRKLMKNVIIQNGISSNSAPKPLFGDSFECANQEEKAEVVFKSKPSPQKNFSLSCWLSNSFPLNLDQFLSVLQIVKTMNPSLLKLQEFLNNEKILKQIPENSFPVKIEVPVTFGIRARIIFTQFLYLNTINQSELQIPNYPQVRRKLGQKILTCPKKRMFLANLVVQQMKVSQDLPSCFINKYTLVNPVRMKSRNKKSVNPRLRLGVSLDSPSYFQTRNSVILDQQAKNKLIYSNGGQFLSNLKMYRQSSKSPFAYQDYNQKFNQTNFNYYSLKPSEILDLKEKESPRIRVKTPFYAAWNHRNKSPGEFKKYPGMLASYGNRPKPDRYDRNKHLRLNSVSFSPQKQKVVAKQPTRKKVQKQLPPVKKVHQVYSEIEAFQNDLKFVQPMQTWIYKRNNISF